MKAETSLKDRVVKQGSSGYSLKPIYVRSVVGAFGGGTISPFISPYAVKELNASPSDMGWFQSLSNLSGNITQVFWGRLSDKLGRRIPFIFLGGFISTIFWIPMLFVTSPGQLIALVVLQALLGSMAAPAWMALIGDLVPSFRLGRTSAAINFWSSVGGFIATLASGAIMVGVGGTIREQFLIPVIVATVCGLLSSFMILYVKEKGNDRSFVEGGGFTPNVFNAFKLLKGSPDFIKYSAAGAMYMLFMSISWPLFTITMIRVLNASMFEVALLSVVDGLALMAFQKWAGRLADTVGRKPLLVSSRFALIAVPLTYAFSPNVYILIAVSAFWSVAAAFWNASSTAYLLDVIPEEHRGSFTAFHNLLMGIAVFIGCVLSGYISDFTTSVFGLVLGLQIVYTISAVGRGLGATLYLTLRETLKRNAPQ